MGVAVQHAPQRQGAVGAADPRKAASCLECTGSSRSDLICVPAVYGGAWGVDSPTRVGHVKATSPPTWGVRCDVAEAPCEGVSRPQGWLRKHLWPVLPHNSLRTGGVGHDDNPFSRYAGVGVGMVLLVVWQHGMAAWIGSGVARQSRSREWCTVRWW